MTNCILQRRFGIVKISMNVITSSTDRQLSELWLNLCPLSIEHHYANDALVIEGASPLFDVTYEGEVLPEYRIEVTQNEFPSGTVAIQQETDHYFRTYKAIRL